MKHKTIPLLALACISLCTHAGPTEYGSYQVKRIISVYDGDTFRADIENLSDIVGKNMPVRINGIDTPEIRGQCLAEKKLAIKAKALTLKILTNAKKITLSNVKRGKYFRLIANVEADNTSIADRLIAAGLARHYDGGKRSNWCPD